MCMTVLIQLPDCLVAASQSKVQPMSRSAVSVRNKKSIQLKKNQISPDFTSAPASTAAVPSTNDNDPLLLQQSSPDVVSIADPLTLQDTILDTASELHLGQGPFDASGSAVNSSQGVAEACGVQLASCGSIMPGQTVG